MRASAKINDITAHLICTKQWDWLLFPQISILKKYEINMKEPKLWQGFWADVSLVKQSFLLIIGNACERRYLA